MPPLGLHLPAIQRPAEQSPPSSLSEVVEDILARERCNKVVKFSIFVLVSFSRRIHHPKLHNY